MKIDMFSHLGNLERMMDFHMERHGVLASNVANAETPGYQAHDLVASEAVGGGALETTNAMHLSASSETASGGSVVELESTRVDGNGVALERALAEISANRLRYEAGVEIARRELDDLRYAATDGGS